MQRMLMVAMEEIWIGNMTNEDFKALQMKGKKNPANSG